MKAVKKPKQQPSQIRRDNDYHWYIVPEDSVTRFEAALEMLATDDWSPEWQKTWDKIAKTAINGPHVIRLLKWQDMS